MQRSSIVRNLIAIYVFVSVAFSIWYFYPLIGRLSPGSAIGLGFNLICLFLGAIALVLKRKVAVLLFAADFVGTGLATILRSGSRFGATEIIGLITTVALILYSGWLSARGVLR